jgi:uncharacterized protein
MTTRDEFIETVKKAPPEEIRGILAKQPELADAEDAQGISAVLWAAYFGRPEIAELLADSGARLNFFEAAALGRPQLVKAALESDPTLATQVSPDGFTALGLAAFFARVDVVKMLLAAEADPNAASRNRMKVTPLHSAVANRDQGKATEMATLLVSKGAEVNVAQEGGWTPLQQAAAHGYTPLVKYLLDHGADIQAKANDGRTAFDLASGAKHQETAALLQAHAARRHSAA